MTSDRETRWVVNKLQAAINEHRLCIVTGAGVSTAIAGLPSWRGLLKGAISFAGQSRHLEQDDIDLALQNLDRKPLLAGQIVKDVFDEGGGGHLFASWLEMIFQNPGTATNADLLGLFGEIHRLHPLIRFATTNYDTIVDEHLHLQPISWNERDNVHKFLQSGAFASTRMLHVHGVWTDAAHVVFSSNDYARLDPHPSRSSGTVLADPLHKLLATYTVLFVGCGGTTTDPHFTQVFAQLARDGPADHVLLYRRAPGDTQPAPAHDRIYSFSHGDFVDLPAALRTVFPYIFPPPSSQLEGNTALPFPQSFPISRQQSGSYSLWHEKRILPGPSSQQSANLRAQYESFDSPQVACYENALAQFIHDYQHKMNLENFKNPRQRGEVNGVIAQGAKSGVFERSWDALRTLMHYLAMNGVADLMEQMMYLGADVNGRDSDGFTPLHLAVIGNHASTVRALLEDCHSDPAIQDNAGLVPWNWALAIEIQDCERSVMEEQIKSKHNIVKVLAKYTSVEHVKNRISKAILALMKVNPDAQIQEEADINRVMPRVYTRLAITGADMAPFFAPPIKLLDMLDDLPPEAEGDTQIFVKTLTGKTVAIMVLLEEDVQVLKRRVYHREGIPELHQRLIWQGKQLEDGRTLRSYGKMPMKLGVADTLTQESEEIAHYISCYDY